MQIFCTGKYKNYCRVLSGEKSFGVQNEKLEIFKLEFSKQLNGDLEIFSVKSVKRAEINNTPSVAQKRF